MAREAKLTEKDMSVLREGDATKTQMERKRANVRDYSLNHRVEIRWDLNDESIRDQMFILRLDDLEVVLDAEEVMRYLRWV